MTRADAIQDQAKTIKAVLFPGVSYLVRLQTRMEKAGFLRDDDELYLIIRETSESSWRLTTQLHTLRA